MVPGVPDTEHVGLPDPAGLLWEVDLPLLRPPEARRLVFFGAVRPADKPDADAAGDLATVSKGIPPK